MRGQLGVSFCRAKGLLIAIAATVPCCVYAMPGAAMVEPDGGSLLFLWLGLGCFGVGGLILLSRALACLRARRRRSNLVRLMWYPEKISRPRGIMGRWPWGGASVRCSTRWEERTRTAEQKAEQALAVLRSELTPHLAQIMRDRLVVTLMTQRARLLSAHQANTEKMAALETRLTAVQNQVRRQTEAYEQRIAQLESELKDKGAVTRELLRFRVLLARQALETVRLAPEAMRSSGR
jgi:hypothetical protein